MTVLRQELSFIPLFLLLLPSSSTPSPHPLLGRGVVGEPSEAPQAFIQVFSNVEILTPKIYN